MTPKIIHVEWVDAVTSLGWEPVSEPLTPRSCLTVGFLIHETDKFIVIAGTWGLEGDHEESNNRTAIPKGWIVAQREIR